MSEYHELLFVVLAFVSEVIGTLSGVSSSTLFVPMAKMLETVPVTLALTATLHVLGNSTRAILYWKNIDWPLTLRFGVTSIICTAIGAQYSDLFSARTYSLVLGLFLMILSSYLIYFDKKTFFSGTWLPYAGGALSGLLTGLLGAGGAVRSMALAGFQLNPLVFTATSTLIDFGGDIARLVIYLQKGYLNKEHYFYIPILMIVAFFANWLAKSWIEKIPREKFKKIVLVAIFGMGLFSVVTNWPI